MKKGFTMIELIFVIVILGILAAIAVPKLTSVKDDAEAAKAVSNLDTFINELTIYYTTHDSKFPTGFTAADVKKLTNVKEIKADTDHYNFRAGNTDNCITIKPENDTIKLTPIAGGGSNGCKILIVAAVKNGLLDGTVNSDGQVTGFEANTVKNVAGAEGGLYDISEAFKPKKPAGGSPAGGSPGAGSTGTDTSAP